MNIKILVKQINVDVVRLILKYLYTIKFNKDHFLLLLYFPFRLRHIRGLRYVFNSCPSLQIIISILESVSVMINDTPPTIVSKSYFIPKINH